MPPWSRPSNRCGSFPTTRKRRCGMSPQSRSGGEGGMHTSGYDGSQPTPDSDIGAGSDAASPLVVPQPGEPRGAGGLLRSGQGEAPRPLHGAVLTRIGALLHRRVENPGRDAGQLIRRATPLARVERLRRRVEVRGITREAILPRCGPVAAPERDVVIVRDGTALKPIRKTCRAAAPR